MLTPDPGIGVAAGGPSDAAPKLSRSPRMPMLDAMRFIAAAGVVWVHSITPGAPTELMHGLGTFGVPFYIFAALYFMTRGFYRDPCKSLLSYAGSRFYRVYLPFVAWCVIYLGVSNLAVRMSHNHIQHEEFHWFQFYAGTKSHLWFLPYLLMVSLLGAVLVKIVRRLPRLRWATVGLMAALGCASLFLPRPLWVTTNQADAMYLQSDFWIPFFRILPVPFWAIALALAWAPGGRGISTNTPLALVGLVVLLASVMMQWQISLFFTPFMEMSRQQIILERLLRGGAGIGGILLATAPWNNRLLTGMAALGRYSYGIFLSHVLVLRIIGFKLDRVLGSHAVAHDVAAFLLAMPVSTLLSYGMSRFKLTRWMLGE